MVFNIVVLSACPDICITMTFNHSSDAIDSEIIDYYDKIIHLINTM